MSTLFSLPFGALLFATGIALQVSPESSPGVATSPKVAICPWLTGGTAANALKGDVVTTVTLTGEFQGVCTFTRQQGSNDELKIFVGGENLPSCPKDSIPVPQIGTHAVECSVHQPQQRLQLMISGAVRDKNFTVSLTTDGSPSATAAPDSQNADTLKQLAEMVAGSLF